LAKQAVTYPSKLFPTEVKQLHPCMGRKPPSWTRGKCAKWPTSRGNLITQWTTKTDYKYMRNKNKHTGRVYSFDGNWV